MPTAELKALQRVRTVIGELPMMRSPLARRLARGGFWSLAADAGTRAFAFVSAIVVARLLGAADFGALALIQGAVGALLTFAQVGMGHTATRFIAACRNSEPARVPHIAGLTLWLSALTGAAVALGLFLAAPRVASDLLGAPGLAHPLRLVAPVVLLSTVSGALSGTVQGFEAFGRLARLTWLTSLGGFLTTVAGVYLGGLNGVVVGLLTGEAIRCLSLWGLANTVMTERGFYFAVAPDLGERRIIWQFSLPLLVGALLHAPVLWLCQAMIARQAGGLTSLGHYHVAQKWMTVVILAPLAASAAFAPVLANMSPGADRLLLRHTTLRLAVVQVTATGGPALAVALLAPFAVRIFGADYAAAAPVLVLTMILAPVFVLKHLYWQAMTASGHALAALWIAGLWAVVALTTTWLLRGHGAVGLAAAMLAAYVAALLVSVILVEWLWRGKAS